MERMIETRSAQETWQAGYEMGQEAVPWALEKQFLRRGLLQAWEFRIQ